MSVSDTVLNLLISRNFISGDTCEYHKSLGREFVFFVSTFICKSTFATKGLFQTLKVRLQYIRKCVKAETKTRKTLQHRLHIQSRFKGETMTRDIFSTKQSSQILGQKLAFYPEFYSEKETSVTPHMSLCDYDPFVKMNEPLRGNNLNCKEKIICHTVLEVCTGRIVRARLGPHG